MILQCTRCHRVFPWAGHAEPPHLPFHTCSNGITAPTVEYEEPQDIIPAGTQVRTPYGKRGVVTGRSAYGTAVVRYDGLPEPNGVEWPDDRLIVVPTLTDAERRRITELEAEAKANMVRAKALEEAAQSEQEISM